jgi:hypothetical protein
MEPLKYWTTDGFEISTYRHGIGGRKGKMHQQSGSDTTGLCTYTYNELGFRGDSIKKEGFKVMSVGCSNTEGVGVSNFDTWPAQFTNNIPNGVNLNFGTGGRSNDFISRCILTYYDLIKPDLVLVMYTGVSRRELYTKDNNIEPFMPTSAWGYFDGTEDGRQIQQNLTQIQNDNEDYINWYKNHLLIKYFLESKKCNWLWNGFFDIPLDYTEFNRFDGKYSRFIDYGVDGVHPGPNNNKLYASDLFKHIYTNFREYLPEDMETPKKILF